jgi:hypothetical protein
MIPETCAMKQCNRVEHYNCNPNTSYICSHCVIAICESEKAKELTKLADKKVKQDKQGEKYRRVWGDLSKKSPKNRL